eukprot:8339626-Pyramimonas_sp.AAC.1
MQWLLGSAVGKMEAPRSGGNPQRPMRGFEDPFASMHEMITRLSLTMWWLSCVSTGKMEAPRF